LKISKSFIVDSNPEKAFKTAQNFFLNLNYEGKNEIKPNLLVFKKRMNLKNSNTSKSEDYIIRLKITINPVGNLQIYSTSLITVRCDFVVKISGREELTSDRKIFEDEAKDLKNLLVKKVLSKKTSHLTSNSSQINVCKEICETSQIQVTFTQLKNEIRVGEKENIEVYIKNVGNTEIFLKKINNILSKEFQPVSSSNGQLFKNGNLDLNRKQLSSLETDHLTIIFEPLQTGNFEIKPRIFYLDDGGNEKFIECRIKVFKVLDAALPGRITTGYKDLDNLLYGGLPENYAVVLTSPSSDEREILIKNFLRVGANNAELTFFLTLKSDNGQELAKKFQSNFFLFLCNPRASGDIANLPNVFKLNGVSTLTKSLRSLDQVQSGPRRICIEIISDILLQHKAVTTRKWLSGILSELKSKGFTILGVVNPLMHPPDQVQAILGLFDGEIKISEKETNEGIENVLRVRKMYNQKYMKSELTIKRERLES